MTTGKRIQAARKKANLSQRELGEKLGVSASMIGQYENDLRKPKFETLRKIADALEIHWLNLADDTIAEAYDIGYEEGTQERSYVEAQRALLTQRIIERRNVILPDDQEIVDFAFEYKTLSNINKETIRKMIDFLREQQTIENPPQD